MIKDNFRRSRRGRCPWNAGAHHYRGGHRPCMPAKPSASTRIIWMLSGARLKNSAAGKLITH